MKHVTPQCFLVAETKAVNKGVEDYLKSIGAPDWDTDAPTDTEGLLEIAGRGCYRSFGAGLNPNVTRVREGNGLYLENIKGQQHGSVFEHCYVSYIFTNVSRVFTHELVRHRVGVGISQESLRFVRLDELSFWIPPIIENHPEAKAIFEETIVYLENRQKELANVFQIDGRPFHEKKQITSAMRRIAPEGLGTMIFWTANFRIMRHVIERRTDPAAEYEIRLVFGEVAKQMVERYPNAFGDYEVVVVDGLPWYKTKNGKI